MKRNSGEGLEGLFLSALIPGFLALFILLVVGMWIDSHMFSKEVETCQQIVKTNGDHSLCKEILENHSLGRVRRQ